MFNAEGMLQIVAVFVIFSVSCNQKNPAISDVAKGEFDLSDEVIRADFRKYLELIRELSERNGGAKISAEMIEGVFAASAMIQREDEIATILSLRYLESVESGKIEDAKKMMVAQLIRFVDQGSPETEGYIKIVEQIKSYARESEALSDWFDGKGELK